MRSWRVIATRNFGTPARNGVVCDWLNWTYPKELCAKLREDMDNGKGAPGEDALLSIRSAFGHPPSTRGVERTFRKVSSVAPSSGMASVKVHEAAIEGIKENYPHHHLPPTTQGSMAHHERRSRTIEFMPKRILNILGWEGSPGAQKHPQAPIKDVAGSEDESDGAETPSKYPPGSVVKISRILPPGLYRPKNSFTKIPSWAQQFQGTKAEFIADRAADAMIIAGEVSGWGKDNCSAAIIDPKKIDREQILHDGARYHLVLATMQHAVALAPLLTHEDAQIVWGDAPADFAFLTVQAGAPDGKLDLPGNVNVVTIADVGEHGPYTIANTSVAMRKKMGARAAPSYDIGWTVATRGEGWSLIGFAASFLFPSVSFATALKLVEDTARLGLRNLPDWWRRASKAKKHLAAFVLIAETRRLGPLQATPLRERFQRIAGATPEEIVEDWEVGEKRKGTQREVDGQGERQEKEGKPKNKSKGIMVECTTCNKPIGRIALYNGTYSGSIFDPDAQRYKTF